MEARIKPIPHRSLSSEIGRAVGSPTAKADPSRWGVYLLRCSDGTLYCGVTNRLNRRLRAHARGQVKYTRGRLPVELYIFERVRDRSSALKREARWKQLSRREKLALGSQGCD